MTEESKPKTLSLNKTKNKGSAKPKERVRSGARARQIAQKNYDPKKDISPAADSANRSRFSHDSDDRPRFNRSSDDRPRFNRNSEDRPRFNRRSDDRPRFGSYDKPNRRNQKIIFPSQTEIFDIFAPCPNGLEKALEQELTDLGYQNIVSARAGCHFQADWPGILKANLYSRIATRILVQLAQADVQTEDDLLYLASKTPWEYWFGPKQKLRVDTSAIRSPMKSLQYCNLRVKDGICDRLREREGARPDIDTVRPDAKVHAFLNENSATLYLDVTGESLFKRGWRLDKGVAPLRENLAAGLLMLSGWDKQSALMDPFCGSGTILIEAAWMALGVPAGIWRPFGFERLRNHNASLWRSLKDEARANIKTELDFPITGSDINEQAIVNAKANLHRANLSEDTIEFINSDARMIKPNHSQGMMITNPPYGERMDDVVLWQQWSAWLKEHYGNWQINIISSDLQLPSQLRLKPKRKHPVYNGALDCRLFEFDLVDGKYQH